MKESPRHVKAQNVHTATKSKDPDKPSQLTRAFTFLFDIFSYHNPNSFSVTSPSTVRERLCCCDTGASLAASTQLQGHPRKLPILQEERDLVTRPYNPMTCSAPLHTLFLQETLDETLSSSDQASSSLCQIGLFGQPHLHTSPESGVRQRSRLAQNFFLLLHPCSSSVYLSHNLAFLRIPPDSHFPLLSSESPHPLHKVPFHLPFLTSLLDSFFLPCHFRPCMSSAAFTFRIHGDAHHLPHQTWLQASPLSLHTSFSFPFCHSSPRRPRTWSPPCTATSSNTPSSLLPYHTPWKTSTTQKRRCLERQTFVLSLSILPIFVTLSLLSLSL